MGQDERGASLGGRHGGWWDMSICLPRATRPKERLLCSKDLECPTELGGLTPVLLSPGPCQRKPPPFTVPSPARDLECWLIT